MISPRWLEHLNNEEINEITKIFGSATTIRLFYPCTKWNKIDYTLLELEVGLIQNKR